MYMVLYILYENCVYQVRFLFGACHGNKLLLIINLKIGFGEIGFATNLTSGIIYIYILFTIYMQCYYAFMLLIYCDVIYLKRKSA